MNEVHNKLVINGQATEIKKLFDFIKGNDTNFDFNKIIPMPEILNINVSNHIVEAAHNAMMLEMNEYEVKIVNLTKERKQTPATFSVGDWGLFNICLENIRATGYVYWYDWCNANWGTKWNALDSINDRNSENTLYFITAWDAPYQLILELSKMFPALQFDYSCAGDRNVVFAESYKIKAGLPFEISKPEKDSNEYYELYFELFPDCKEEDDEEDQE